MNVPHFSTVLYEMFGGDHPMSAAHAETIIWRVGNGKGPSVANLRCHLAMKSLIKLCWAVGPSDRPTFAAILKQLHESVRSSDRRPSFTVFIHGSDVHSLKF